MAARYTSAARAWCCGPAWLKCSRVTPLLISSTIGAPPTRAMSTLVNRSSRARIASRAIGTSAALVAGGTARSGRAPNFRLWRHSPVR